MSIRAKRPICFEGRIYDCVGFCACGFRWRYVRCFASASHDVTELRLIALHSQFREASSPATRQGILRWNIRDLVEFHRGPAGDNSRQPACGLLAAMHSGVAAVQSVIKISSESDSKWLRNSLWCTSRFDIVPQD